MFGNMLLELLYGEDTESSGVRHMGELSGTLRSLIFLCCNARDTLDHFQVGGKATNQPSGAAGSLGQSDSSNATNAGRPFGRQPVRILPNVDGTADEGDEFAHADEDDHIPDQKEAIELRLEVNDGHFADLSIQQIIGNPYWRQDVEVLDMMDFFGARYAEYRSKKMEYDKLQYYLERNVG